MSGVFFALAFSALLQPAADTTTPLTFDEFYAAVASNHPVVRQARLLEEIAAGEVTMARGAFDPSLVAGWDRKTFGGTRYYDYVDATLKVPTPFGVDVKVGYEKATGRYIAPDRLTPGQGLLTAGVSVPIGQRWLTDERRTALAQARALRDYARGDRTAIVNKLLLDAAKLYGAWYEAHGRRALASEGLALAEFRLRAVRSRVTTGDAAAIDTTEALLETQRRQVQLYEAELDAQNRALEVEGFLWGPRGEALPLAPGTVPSAAGLEPVPIDSTRMASWVATAERNHPSIQKAAAKAEQARAEQRLSAQQVFVPAGELSYSAIGDRALGASNVQDAFGTSADAKLGGEIKIPLLYLKERGKFSAASDKLTQQQLELRLARRDVGIAVSRAANELRALDGMLALQRQAAQQARLLRDGEQRKFDAGESTLFLVNTRERTVIDEGMKVLALEAKYASARAALAVALGEPARLPAPGSPR